MEYERIQNIQKERIRKRVGGPKLPDFKTHYKAMVTDSVSLAQG